MLRLLKKMGIPNVIDFSLTDPVYNEQALLTGFNVKQRSFKSESKTQRNSEMNAYLAKQFKRLKKHAASGNWEAFNKVGLNLLQNSTSYLIYSFNSVMPDWQSMDFHKSFNVLKGARKLCKELATDIDYKRVWIDKKPYDYARPLGVPKVIWRIYLRMVTNEGEIFAHGRDLYHPSQHGGRPGYGVMSCLKDVAEQLPKYKRVYEFDIKGFFDHISHESMTTIFKGTFLEGLYSKMCKSTPKSFKLPPVEKDLAVKRAETNKKTNEFLESLGLGAKPLTRDDLYKLQKGTKPLKVAKVEFSSTNGIDPLMLNYTKPRMANVYKDLMQETKT